jgi:type IV pilus assembly protein PilA
MNFNKKGFTLIELLIVIGIIAILAAGVIVAINPGRQFAQARDATRRSHINTLNKALLSYQVSNQGNLSGLSLPTEPTEICNTNLTSPNMH